MTQLIKIAGWSAGARLNVVFVHGLGGHPYGTWRRGAEGSAFWPEWLARDIPGLAVWTLAYDAPPTNWLGTAMPIQDRAKNVLEWLPGRRELRGAGLRGSFPFQKVMPRRGFATRSSIQPCTFWHKTSEAKASNLHQLLW